MGALFGVIGGFLAVAFLRIAGTIFRYWYISIPIIVTLHFVAQTAAVNARKHELTERGYLADTFAAEELANAVHIDVPIHLSSESTGYSRSGYPVTLENSAKRAFEGQFYVVCVATQTVAFGPGEPVIGVRQWPYTMSQRVHINPQSISTEYFDRAGENSLEQFTNLNRCKFFPDGSAAEDAARLIDTKWVQVTPFGVSESRKMNYIDGQLVPQQANSADYRNPWLE